MDKRIQAPKFFGDLPSIRNEKNILVGNKSFPSFDVMLAVADDEINRRLYKRPFANPFRHAAEI